VCNFRFKSRNEGATVRVQGGEGELAMVDQDTAALPDGTDKVIEGASQTEDTAVVTSKDTSAAERGIVDRFREGSEQLSNQAGERARGIVTQGLERTSEALANVSKMVSDTAAGIDDRLGEEYGDYARRAAGALEDTANRIAAKDPDELIEDTRNFIRNSPGIALAGAAVVGFVVARLLKSGVAATNEDEDED